MFLLSSTIFRPGECKEVDLSFFSRFGNGLQFFSLVRILDLPEDDQAPIHSPVKDERGLPIKIKDRPDRRETKEE
jgi:hypothetical protein